MIRILMRRPQSSSSPKRQSVVAVGAPYRTAVSFPRCSQSLLRYFTLLALAMPMKPFVAYGAVRGGWLALKRLLAGAALGPHQAPTICA